jgi:hypothetical protein
MRCAKFLFPLAALALGGCATSLSMTYRSDPPGAMLYESGRAVGYAPQTLNYTPTEAFKHGACMNLRAVSVQWISGVSTSPAQTNACGSVGYNQELTFVRPSGLAGRDLDVQWAIHLQQAALAQDQANAAAWEAAAASYRAPQSARCISSQVGTLITTNCN